MSQYGMIHVPGQKWDDASIHHTHETLKAAGIHSGLSAGRHDVFLVAHHHVEPGIKALNAAGIHAKHYVKEETQITRFVELAETKQAGAFQTQLETVLGQKIAEALENKKQEVASQMFNEEVIAELKTSTLKSYIEKVGDRQHEHNMKGNAAFNSGDKKTAKKHYKAMYDHSRGLALARRKIDKKEHPENYVKDPHSHDFTSKKKFLEHAAKQGHTVHDASHPREGYQLHAKDPKTGHIHGVWGSDPTSHDKPSGYYHDKKPVA